MMQRRDVECKTATVMSKMFLVMILLHYSLGFSVYEDNFQDYSPGFYHLFEDGVWDNLHKKLDRGYIPPVPRVGKRKSSPHQDKRQTMIPQPRLGREIELGDEISEALWQIRQALGKIQDGVSNGGHSSNDVMKMNPVAYGNGINLRSLMEGENESKYEASQELGETAGTEPVKSPVHGADSVSDYKENGFDLFEENKRQGGLIPAARLGRETILTALEEMKPQTNGQVFTYPRSGRHFWEMHRTLIPYPRAGRYTFDTDSMDYDTQLNPGYGPSGLNDELNDPILTKRSIRLVPRIGRKKRSVSSKDEAKDESDNDQKLHDAGQFFDDLEDVLPDYYFSSSGQSPSKRRSKMTFVPRIGKKRSEEKPQDKRVIASFTPRVGRTAFVPRIGRNDMRFRLMSRAALIPRVGKRAKFIPRLGRTDKLPKDNEGSD